MMAQAFYTMRIFAPAIAGLLVYLVGENSCFYGDSASFVFSAAMLSTVSILRTVQSKEQQSKGVRSLLQDFSAGGRFILTHPALSFVMIAMMAGMFVLSCFSPLISVYVRDSLHAGTRSFGVISAMIGVGLIAGTQTITKIGKGRSNRHLALAGLFSLAIATAVLAAFQFTVIAGVSMFGIGFAIACIMVPAQTLIQQETPHEMLGRVSSSFMSLFSSSQVLGLVLSGSMADRLGIRMLFLLSAVLLVILSVGAYLWIRNSTPDHAAVAAAG
jgi:predicted MFS family arabinose efflux permease